MLDMSSSANLQLSSSSTGGGGKEGEAVAVERDIPSLNGVVAAKKKYAQYNRINS